MKYIKKFEMNDNEPKLGDYVICNHDDSNLIYSNEETEFISNKIGRIINIDKEEFFKYFISYDCYIPFSIYDGHIDDICYIKINRKSIKYWSEDKEELEVILKSNKFNI